MNAIDKITDLVTIEIMTEWLKSQTEPGIYKIMYDPDDDKVYVSSTYSGDNSYIPGDNRICLALADIRESLSMETVGLDEDGDIIDSDTYNSIIDECENRLTEAENDGDIEFN